jgi:cyclophilin family peptidyl-prolyl cis-trans isomerase
MLAVVLAAGCGRQEAQQQRGTVEGPKMVELKTSRGSIVIELFEEESSVTVGNFLKYVEAGFYDGTIFHRVIPEFMIQGGGFTAGMQRKQTHPAIVNEASHGLKNDRGTIAMARQTAPDTATSQFFINQRDNDSLNYVAGVKPGYAVFGRVVEGMDVVDGIASVKTTRKGPYSDVPVEAVVIESAAVVSPK